MRAEAEYADRFLAYSATLSSTVDGVFVEHPWAAWGVAGAVIVGAWLLHPAAPSIHPSPSTRVSRVDSGRPERRRTGGGSAVRVERVSGRKEPPPKAFTVPRLVPQGPRPRRHWRWGLPPWWWEVKGYVTGLLGAGGVGKSFVLLDLGLAALEPGGGFWFGLKVRPARCVLYVDAELDIEECQRRAHPLARGRGYEEPPAGLHYLNIVGHTLAPLKAKEDDGMEYEYQPGVELIDAAVARLKPDLILLDSTTLGSPGASASDEKAWNKVFTAMEMWGCPVVAIDHMDRAGRGAYGSFMKQAKVRSRIKLSERAGGILVEHDKINFGAKAKPFMVYPEFGDAEADPDDYIVRFGTEPPSIHQEPSVDGQEVSGATPPVLAPSHAAPLRLVPPTGEEGTRMAIFGWIKAHPGLTRQQIVKAIQASELKYAESTTQKHLKALLEAGLLVEDGGLLRLRADAKEATG